MRAFKPQWGALLLGLCGSACYSGLDEGATAPFGDDDGAEGDGGEDAQGDAGDDDDDDDPVAGCAPPSQAMRRLSRRELDRTLADLLGDTTEPARRLLPDDLAAGGFDTHVLANPITESLAYDYLILAEDVSSRVAEDPDALTGCDAATDECALAFFTDLCPRAKRRPCETAEVDAWMEARATAIAVPEATVGDGYRVVLATMLQSADFLYRPEIGQAVEGAPERVELTSIEVANRLSYLLWGTMPDEALFEAAVADSLRDPEVLVDQARRMLDDPRATAQVVSFHQQWLGISGIAQSTKQEAGFAALREHLAAQSAALIDDVARGGGDLEELLTASYTYLNDPLAEFYGLPLPGSGDALVKVALPEGRHAGVLTQPAFMATHASQTSSSPVRRGLTVLESLLCTHLPPPPPDVDDSLPDVNLDGTTRQRYETHTTNPTCAACHAQIDGLGFAFEHFDQVGRWRDTENGLPIDASGELIGTDVDGPFDGAAELGARLADSEMVAACYVDHLFEFAYGRTTSAEDGCVTEALADSLAESDGQLESVLVALVSSEAFRFRSVAQ